MTSAIVAGAPSSSTRVTDPRRWLVACRARATRMLEKSATSVRGIVDIGKKSA